MTGKKIQAICVCVRSNSAYQAQYRGVPFERFYIFHKDAASSIPRIFTSALMWSAAQRLGDGSKLCIGTRIVQTVATYMGRSVPDDIAVVEKNSDDYLLVLPLQFFKWPTHPSNLTNEKEKVVWRMQYISVRPSRIILDAWLHKAQMLYRGKWETACARCPQLWEHVSTGKACNTLASHCRRNLSRSNAPVVQPKGLKQWADTLHQVSNK